MKKILLIVGLVGMVISANAQDKIKKARGIRMMGTFSPGILTSTGEPVYYLTGQWNYYFNEHISLAGEGSYFMSSLKTPNEITANHKLLGGFNYHFNSDQRFDPFIGLQMGVGLVGRQSLQLINVKRLNEVVPLISPTVGMNYYVGSIFHFFGHVRFNSGTSLEAFNEKRNMDEWQLMVGLGLNFGVKKQ